jgi:hypothetical protein
MIREVGCIILLEKPKSIAGGFEDLSNLRYMQGVAAEVEMHLRGPARMLTGSHMHVQVENGRCGSLTRVCIQREQQEIMGLLCKIVIGACSRQPVWLWQQEELLEVQVMYLDSALVVGSAPSCSARD